MTTNPQFPLFQLHVANRLGVSEDKVRELRAAKDSPLKEGRDWVRNGTRLLFALGAIDRLAAVLNVSQMPSRPAPGPALLAWPETHQIVVVRLWPNTRYVSGVILPASNGYHNGFAPVPPLGAPLLRVRVKTSENLARGMVIECTHVGADLYEATKLPRRKGRW